MNDNYDYYIVTTLSDDKNVIEHISEKLLNAKLVAGSQISVVTSTFWWEGRIQVKEEYKLEVRTREDKIDDIELSIVELHNYKTPEISAKKIDFLNLDMKIWIDNILKDGK